MCCLACIEFAKESLTPEEFVSNFIEVINSKYDDPHMKEIEQVVDSLSEEYKDKIEAYVNEEILNG